jgi:hypothetical protein
VCASLWSSVNERHGSRYPRMGQKGGKQELNLQAGKT